MLYRKGPALRLYFINAKELKWFPKSRGGAESQNANEGTSTPLKVPVSCTLGVFRGDETASRDPSPDYA